MTLPIRMQHEGIQGLRALAALAVVGAHSINTLIRYADLDRAYRPAAEALGQSGVRIRIVPIYCWATLAFIALAFVPFRNKDRLYQPVYGLGGTLNYEI